jgi:hypothetical protein
MPIINWFDLIDIEEVGRAVRVASRDKFLWRIGFNFDRHLRFKIDVPPTGPIRGFSMTCDCEDAFYYDSAKVVLETSYGGVLRNQLAAYRKTWRSS